ncbi:MAG: hypothetical protein HQK49_01805 [Oligoflexia bacterium]|nr:hypothetical protein [Oligoflexia bacterium]
MKIKKFRFNTLLSILFTLLISINTVHAGILFEPLVGYALNGQVSQKFIEGGTTYKFTYTGIGYGFRFGYSGVGFMGGLQADMINEEWKGKEPLATGINDEKSKFNGLNLGLFIGYHLPSILRFWGTFYAYDKYTKTDDVGAYSKDDYLLGMGYSLGIGVAPIPILSINVEYRNFMLDKIYIKADSKLYKLDKGRDVSKSEIFVSVSFPLGLSSK